MAYKRKTKQAAAKRFKVTSTGKVMYSSPGKKHLLEHKLPGNKRAKGMIVASESDMEKIRTCLPYL